MTRIKFPTRSSEHVYLEEFRRYLTDVGFYMADRVIDHYLDENRGWSKKEEAEREIGAAGPLFSERSGDDWTEGEN